MIVIAIDPGIRIGCAVCMDGPYRTCTYDQSTLADFYDTLRAADRVILEDFDTGGRVDHNMLRTVQVIGGVKAVCLLHHVRFELQWPQERRSFIQDAIDLLKKQGRRVVNTKQEDNHEIDALAHLLAWEHYQTHPQDRPKRRGEHV